jgi:hypothetical protein
MLSHNLVQYHTTLDMTVRLLTRRWLPRGDELVLKMMTMLTAIINVTYFPSSRLTEALLANPVSNRCHCSIESVDAL